MAHPSLATELFARYRPRTLVLNAGTTPTVGPLSQQTGDSFSSNWDVDVRHVFQFVREALVRPLDPGSTVISLSSGAAVRGSPLSGGYSGANQGALIAFALVLMMARRTTRTSSAAGRKPGRLVPRRLVT